MNVERRRSRIVTVFVFANLVQDVVLAFAGLCHSLAVVFQGFSTAAQNVSQTMAFVKYDQGRKYEDLTGGDFGTVINCPGHYSGRCSHAEARAVEDDDDDD